MVDIGYAQGESSPCVFFNEAVQGRALVHGDDFVIVARRSELDRVQTELERRYDVRTEKLGWARGKAKEARIVGRILRLTPEGATIEADPA